MKVQLESLVMQMHLKGILYEEAVQEFKKVFVTTALRENRWNRSKTAHQMQMHRNTLSRLTAELEIEVPRSRHGPQRASGGISDENSEKKWSA
jgi:DNA-binding NtrC family response regulator